MSKLERDFLYNSRVDNHIACRDLLTMLSLVRKGRAQMKMMVVGLRVEDFGSIFW